MARLTYRMYYGVNGEFLITSKQFSGCCDLIEKEWEEDFLKDRDDKMGLYYEKSYRRINFCPYCGKSIEIETIGCKFYEEKE